MSETEKKKGGKGCLRKIIVGAILLAVVAGAGAWFARGWIIEKAQALLDEQLISAKIYASYESPGYLPGRGLVIENVALFVDPEKTQKMMELENVGVSVSFMSLIRGEGLGGEITVSNADLSVYPPDGKVRRIEGLDLEVVRTPGLVTIAECAMQINGLEVEAGGIVHLPEAAKTVDEAGNEVAEKATDESPLKPLADALPKVAEVYDMLAIEAKSAPLLTAKFANTKEATGTFSGEAKFKGDEFVWRGIAFDSLGVSVATDDGSVVDIKAVSLSMPGTSLKTAGMFDVKAQTLSLGTLSGSIDPMEVAKVASNGKAKSPVTFTKAWTVTGSGLRIPVSNIETASGKILLTGAEVKVETGNEPLVLSNVQSEITIADNSAMIDSGSMELLGSMARFKGRVPALMKPKMCEIQFVLDPLVMNKLKGPAGIERELKGNVNAKFAGRIFFQGDPVSGYGRVSILESRFYDGPLIGPLLGLLKTVAPGISETDTQNLNVDFGIDGTVVTIKEAVLESITTVVKANGNVNYATEAINFDATANFRGAVGVATALVSKALEINASGSFSDPKWGFKNLPGIKELMNVTGAAVGAGTAVTGAALDAGKAVTGAALDAGTAVTGAAMETGTAVTGAALKTGTAVTGAALKTGSAVTGAAVDTAEKLRPGILFKKKKKKEDEEKVPAESEDSE